MRTSFVPKDFQVPNNVVRGEYKFVAITTKDVLEDWLVVTANAEIISKTRGGGTTGGWPFNYPLEENYEDLAWLELCAKSNQLFSYIIRRKDTNAYAGCLYIYPIELFYSEKANEYDVDFSFWVTQEEFGKGNYEKVFKDLLDWLSNYWPFERSRIFLRNTLIPQSLQ